MSQHNISVACILEFENKILMIKESQNGTTNWDMPAGGLDERENIFDGVRREVSEEVGILIKDPKLITTFQTITKYESSFCFLFKCKLSTKEFSQLNIAETDILDYKLFSKSEVQSFIDNDETEHELAKRRLMEFLAKSIEKNNLEII
jgi:8-oxo-dGTP pyrophosphatase MutT (NUDIX family)